MIGQLTRDEVSKLTAEQQEIIGRVVLDEAGAQRKLLSSARRYRGYQMVPTLFWLGLVCLICLDIEAALLIPVLAIGLLLIIQFHAAGVNSRIDAVIELLESEDRKPQSQHPVETNL